MDDTTFKILGAVASIVLIGAGLRYTRHVFLQGLSIVLLVLLIGMTYFTPGFLLGKAKPISLESGNLETVQEASVLSATFVEDQAIYLTLIWGEVPNLYSIPWETSVVAELLGALSEAEKTGAFVVMREPFETTWKSGEPRFYVHSTDLPEEPPDVSELPEDSEFFDGLEPAVPASPFVAARQERDA